MKSANEARSETYKIVNADMLSSLASVEKCIDVAIQNGEESCYVYFYLTNEVIQKLKELGYEMEDCCSQRDGDCFRVSWS